MLLWWSTEGVSGVMAMSGVPERESWRQEVQELKVLFSYTVRSRAA